MRARGDHQGVGQHGLAAALRGVGRPDQGVHAHGGSRLDPPHRRGGQNARARQSLLQLTEPCGLMLQVRIRELGMMPPELSADALALIQDRDVRTGLDRGGRGGESRRPCADDHHTPRAHARTSRSTMSPSQASR